MVSKAMLNKANLFRELRLIVMVNPNWYIVKPLPKNKQKHNVKYTKDGWVCDCQYYRTTGKDCSHIIAVRG